MSQNLLLSTGLTSLIRADDRPIVPHKSFITFQKWICAYPNDSIIVINYSADVLYTILKSLKDFVVFMSEYHPHTFILFTHLSHTQKHVTPTHLCITTLWPTHIQLTNLPGTHMSLVNLSNTQFSLTWIQGSLTCQLHTYNPHRYHPMVYIWLVDTRLISEPFSESKNTYSWLNQTQISTRLD